MNLSDSINFVDSPFFILSFPPIGYEYHISILMLLLDHWTQFIFLNYPQSLCLKGDSQPPPATENQNNVPANIATKVINKYDRNLVFILFKVSVISPY